MNQEEKELLLKDLCARLPYRVIVKLDDKFKFNKGERVLVKELLDLYCVEGIKPYLRPMSSMTEEEYQICNVFKSDIMTQGYGAIEIYVTRFTNWLDKKHFDWRRTGNNKTLIEAGLALEAPEDMYNIKEK